MMLRRSPYFNIHMESNKANYRTGCFQFRDLLLLLIQFSPDTAGWRVYRSLEEGQNETGLDPISQMEEIISFYQLQGLDNPDGKSSMFIDAAVFRDSFSNKNIDYQWNSPIGRDRLTLKLDDMRHVAPVTLDRYIALADILIKWWRPRYMWVGDPNYWHDKHSMFDNVRTLANWFAWVPQTVDPVHIPSAHLVQPHLGGTLVVTQPDFFNINDNQPAIDRANAVEYEMNEAGVLPRLIDLN
jgi:Immunity protein 52